MSLNCSKAAFVLLSSCRAGNGAFCSSWQSMREENLLMEEKFQHAVKRREIRSLLISECFHRPCLLRLIFFLLLLHFLGGGGGEKRWSPIRVISGFLNVELFFLFMVWKDSGQLSHWARSSVNWRAGDPWQKAFFEKTLNFPHPPWTFPLRMCLLCFRISSVQEEAYLCFWLLIC